MIRLPGMFGMVRRDGGIDRHAAHRIERLHLMRRRGVGMAGWRGMVGHCLISRAPRAFTL
jgi:hypothetical protein